MGSRGATAPRPLAALARLDLLEVFPHTERVSRFVAVHFRALPLEAVFSDAPPPAENVHDGDGASVPSTGADLRPCAVKESHRGRSVLVAVSAAALAKGVRPGMTEAEGKATLAELVVRDRETSVEWVRLEHAAELLFAYGPEVEVCPPATLFVEVSRSRRVLQKRFGHSWDEAFLTALVEEMVGFGHEVTAALADDLDTARTLAEHLSFEALERNRPPPTKSRGRRSAPPSAPAPLVPIRVAAPGRARAALAGLPLTALAWTTRREDPDRNLELELKGVCEALRQLGIRKVGQLAQMGARELGARFGVAGSRMAARASGTLTRPLAPYTPAERLEESFELDAVTEDLEPILFVLRRLLHRLERRMSARQRAAGALTMDFVIEPGLEREVALDAEREASSKRRVVLTLELARPTRSAETLFAVARERIGNALPGAVLAIRVVAESPETDKGAQLDLFSRRAQKTEAMAELVGRLSAALGSSAVFTPKLADTHRPEAAWTSEAFSVDAALAPSRPPVRKVASAAAPAMVEARPGTSAPLPVVDEHLSVVGSTKVGLAAPRTTDAPSAWPKPKVRRPEDEPRPPLPPRPLELLTTPERATFVESGQALAWRGRRLKIQGVTGREHLDTEWWRASPLERDYRRVETTDGRELWVFVTPSGDAYVHGIFD